MRCGQRPVLWRGSMDGLGLKLEGGSRRITNVARNKSYGNFSISNTVVKTLMFITYIRIK